MGHGYVRANYGDNCFYRDSSFKRYNRAHGDTTIFNFNYGNSYGCCGGGHSRGFWGGLGLGIGYNLGNLLMGGMNMLGGWLGMGNMGCFGNMFGGMGMGIGMGIGNGWGFGGNVWGNGQNNGVTKNNGSDSTGSTKTKTDKEYKSINEARKQLQALQDKNEPVTADEIKALAKQIGELTAKDSVNDDENKKQIEMLKHDFDKLKKANPEAAAEAEAEEGTDGTNGTGNSEDAGDAGNTNGAGKTDGEDGSGKVDGADGTNGSGSTQGTDGSDSTGGAGTAGDDAVSTTDAINNATNATELMEALPKDGYEKLTDAEKKAYADKLTNLLPNMSEEDKKALLEKGLPTELNAKIKASFYKKGYTNYNGQTELKNGDVILAHDVSGKTKDTVRGENKAESTITKSANGNHPQTIVIHDRKDVTYTYKETKDGEYIYTSDQDKQDYVLQKGTDGKFHLMQYAYHKGYGERDWS